MEAGFESIAFIDDSIAIALAYDLHLAENSNKKFMIIDFGESGFNVSII